MKPLAIAIKKLHDQRPEVTLAVVARAMEQGGAIYGLALEGPGISQSRHEELPRQPVWGAIYAGVYRGIQAMVKARPNCLLTIMVDHERVFSALAGQGQYPEDEQYIAPLLGKMQELQAVQLALVSASHSKEILEKAQVALQATQKQGQKEQEAQTIKKPQNEHSPGGLISRGRYLLYCDGAANPNPGNSALGFAIFDDSGQEVAAEACNLGYGTNNTAEYHSLIEGLKKAISLGIEEIEARMDSNLVVQQVNGLWKIKEPNLVPLCQEAVKLKSNFSKFKLVYVPREKNKRADELSKKGLAGN